VDPRRFDAFAEEYDFAASLERSPDFFLRHLPEKRERVLDVGCGTGILSLELSRHFASVLAVDLSEPMLDVARRRRSAANVIYRRMDANALDLEGSFDAIVSHTTFHHLDDVPRTLARLAEHLASGGRLILVDNVSERPAIPSSVYVVGAFVELPRDVVRHGPRSAARLLRFRLSRPWLAHLRSDRYLSRDGFHVVYGDALPGASFVPLGPFMGVVWEAPALR
jgi:2-polyprenyl-3-methyl-5-hydroxy-6-metoxy-1,4-benzoquinol methylase